MTMNLTVLLSMVIAGAADRMVIGSRTDGLTAAELQQRALAGGAMAREHEADAIVYLATNGPAFPVAMFAAAYAGVPLVPLNYRLGEAQLRSLLGHHPAALVVVDAAHASVATELGARCIHADELLNAPAAEGAVVDGNPDDVAVVIYTSGTTSEPKGVVLRHGQLVSYVLNSVEFLSASPDESTLISVPPYHIAAVANAITNLYAGRRTVALPGFSAEVWLETVRQESVTNALVVPTMLARLVESSADKDVPSLRVLAYGGAPTPGTIVERALRLWPHVGFVNAYGLTETSSTIALLGPEDHRLAMTDRDPAVRARLSSVGQVLPGLEVEIRDDEGRRVAPGVDGLIHVRGGQVSSEYKGSGPIVDAGGFFNTRDRGYLDEGGYLFVIGRVDDTIIRGAENIAPAEIEEVLLRHPAVSDCAVVGLPDEEWGQCIEAVVVLRSDVSLDPNELKAFVRSTLRGSKTPERIWVWDELPRTETGKLVRRKIVARLTHDGTVAAQ